MITVALFFSRGVAAPRSRSRRKEAWPRPPGGLMSNATAIAARQFGKRRRDRNRAAGRCVNDTVAPTHGPIVAHARCQSCFATKVEADRPSSIECPQCFAPPMKPCRASNGVAVFTRCHKVRAEEARKKVA